MIESVHQGLNEVFQAVFDDDIEVRRDLTAAEVDGWDSLRHVRLLLTIERKFKIKIAASEAARLKTVGELMDLIEAKLNGAGS